MARRELQTDSVTVDQAPPLDLNQNLDEREGEIVRADPSIADKEYKAALAFANEPVTILIHPPTEENAPQFVQVWNNGASPELWNGNRWVPTYGGMLPTGENITIKRKFVEELARSKTTKYTPNGSGINPLRSDAQNNHIPPRTLLAYPFSVVHDANPKGPAWLAEHLRRNY